MKTLVDVAVFGLVPLPPMPDTLKSNLDTRRTASKDEEFYFRHLPVISQPITERMATKDEIARIRREFDEIAAKPSATKGPRHSRAGAPAALPPECAAAGRATWALRPQHADRLAQSRSVS